eukprot:GDKI01035992.1.p1 GENE.GDKI01035992.1~~GDKI01035992.1.p1  ORF type:complete len:400 (-),score=75.54 GDKI01035992.1:22-1221(-)
MPLLWDKIKQLYAFMKSQTKKKKAQRALKLFAQKYGLPASLCGAMTLLFLYLRNRSLRQQALLYKLSVKDLHELTDSDIGKLVALRAVVTSEHPLRCALKESVLCVASTVTKWIIYQSTGGALTEKEKKESSITRHADMKLIPPGHLTFVSQPPTVCEVPHYTKASGLPFTELTEVLEHEPTTFLGLLNSLFFSKWQKVATKTREDIIPLSIPVTAVGVLQRGKDTHAIQIVQPSTTPPTAPTHAHNSATPTWPVRIPYIPAQRFMLAKENSSGLFWVCGGDFESVLQSVETTALGWGICFWLSTALCVGVGGYLLRQEYVRIHDRDVDFTDTIPSGVEANVEGCDEPCVICMSEQRKILLVPCGHVALCEPCSLSVETCPLCKADISSRVRLRGVFNA